MSKANPSGAYRTVPSGEPSRFSVDGSFAIQNNEGVIFLFNSAPNSTETPGELVFDARLGFDCGTVSVSTLFDVTELWPRNGTLIATKRCGESLAGLPLDGRDARLWRVSMAKNEAKGRAATGGARMDGSSVWPLSKTVLPADPTLTTGSRSA